MTTLKFPDYNKIVLELFINTLWWLVFRMKSPHPHVMHCLLIGMQKFTMGLHFRPIVNFWNFCIPPELKRLVKYMILKQRHNIYLCPFIHISPTGFYLSHSKVAKQIYIQVHSSEWNVIRLSICALVCSRDRIKAMQTSGLLLRILLKSHFPTQLKTCVSWPFWVSIKVRALMWTWAWVWPLFDRQFTYSSSALHTIIV